MGLLPGHDQPTAYSELRQLPIHDGPTACSRWAYLPGHTVYS